MAHEHLNETMFHFCVDLEIDLKKPLYIHTIPDPIPEYLLNLTMQLQMENHGEPVIHDLRILPHYEWDNFRTKCISVFPGPFTEYKLLL